MNRLLTILIITAAGVPAQDSAPLFTAMRHNDFAQVKALLEQGADPNAPNPEGTPALMFAAILCDPPVMKLLVSKGAAPNARNPAGATALMWAAGDPGL